VAIVGTQHLGAVDQGMNIDIIFGFAAAFTGRNTRMLDGIHRDAHQMDDIS
jgi:hypothetical protein